MVQGRNRIDGDGAQPPKGERCSYDYAFKLSVINYFAQHRDMVSTIYKFFKYVGERERTLKITVYKWIRQRDLIEKKASSSKTKNQRRHRNLGDGTALKREWEECIVKWIQDLRVEGIPVTSKMLELKADEVARANGVNRAMFKASPTWRKLFMNRHRLSIRQRTRQGQKTPEDGARVLEEFSKTVKELMVVEGITRVYNADQTGVCYEYLPKKTVNTKGKVLNCLGLYLFLNFVYLIFLGVRTVWVKCGGVEKERMTAMLLADSDGTKYPMFLVVKSPASKLAHVVTENLTKRQGFGRAVWAQIEPLQNSTGNSIYGEQFALC